MRMSDGRGERAGLASLCSVHLIARPQFFYNGWARTSTLCFARRQQISPLLMKWKGADGHLLEKTSRCL